MATLTKSFEKELPQILGQVAEDLGRLLDVEVEFSADDIEFLPLSVLFPRLGPGVICCRSIFTKKSGGVGGLLVPEDLAVVASRAMTMVEEPDEPEPFIFEGMVSEAMEELWNNIIGSWNAVASPDQRMSSKTDERSVEYFPTHSPLPEGTGVFPHVLWTGVRIGEREGHFGFFPPLKAVQGRDLAGFTPPSRFVAACAPAFTPGVAADERVGRARPDGPKRPVVFLDYSGRLLAWLRGQARAQDLQCTLAKSFDPQAIEPGPLPAAAILVGVDPTALQGLPDCSVVEIRRR